MEQHVSVIFLLIVFTMASVKIELYSCGRR